MAISYRTGNGAANLDNQGRKSRFRTRKSSIASATTFKKALGGGKIVY